MPLIYGDLTMQYLKNKITNVVARVIEFILPILGYGLLLVLLLMSLMSNFGWRW